MIKRMFPVILIALCVLFSVKALAAGYTYKAQLTGPESEIYDALLGEIQAGKSEVSFKFSVPANYAGADTANRAVANMAYRAFEAFYRDHPEVFWVSKNGIGVETSALPDNGGFRVEGGKITVKLNDESQIATKKQQLESELSKIVSSATGSEFERVKKFHKAIVEKCSYDESAKNNPQLNPFAYESYGALVTGRAVCEGYAKAMKLLCDRAGIASVIVGGRAGGEDHMWNYVSVDGNYYLLDATFDDPIGGSPTEEFLLKGSESTKTHRAEGGFIEGFNAMLKDPPLSAKDYNAGAVAASTSPTPTPQPTGTPAPTQQMPGAGQSGVSEQVPDSVLEAPMEDAPDQLQVKLTKPQKSACRVDFEDNVRGGMYSVRYVGDPGSIDNGQKVMGGVTLEVLTQPDSGYKVGMISVQMGNTMVSERNRDKMYFTVMDDCEVTVEFVRAG